jgi:hypothetical protein
MVPRCTKHGSQTFTAPEMLEPVDTVQTAMEVNLVLQNTFF